MIESNQNLLKKDDVINELKIKIENLTEEKTSQCEEKIKDHVVYARVIHGQDDLEKNYKIMDLSNPMISKQEKNYLDKVVESKDIHYIPDQFIAMYNQDKLGGLIRNVEYWIKDIFENLVIKK